MKVSNERATQLVFYAALTLLIAGAGFLLLTTERVGGLAELWPLAVILAGAFYCYAAASAARRGRALFPGVFVSLAALARFSAGLSGLALADYWPLYVVAVGLSVGISGYAAYRRLRAGYLVPSLAFVLLGGLFLIFSFGFSSMSFSAFISRWWPGFLVTAGIILFSVYFLMRALASGSGKGPANP